MGFGVWGLGFGVWGLGFGVWGLGFGVWGLGFGVWGLGFGVWGLGFRRNSRKTAVIVTTEHRHGREEELVAEKPGPERVHLSVIGFAYTPKG